MKKLLTLTCILALGGLISIFLASCGSDGSSSAEASPTQTSSNYTSPVKTEGSSPARLAGDGRYFGYVRAVNAESQSPTISFDVAQFFFGKDVQNAAEADGAVPSGEPVANDHYERNSEARPQTLTLSEDTQVTAAEPVTRLTVPPGTTASIADFFASFANKPQSKRGSAAGGPFWVTIRDGLVVRIDEQYFP